MAKIAALKNDQLFEKSHKLLKEIPFSKVSVKLKGILALKDNDISKVAKVLSVSRNSLKSWVRNFDAHGIEGLMPKAKNSRKSKLSDSNKEEIQKWINDNPNLTLKELSLMVKDKFGIDISLTGLWKNLKKMNLSYITARPRHFKQDKNKLDEFKKNSYQN